MYNQAKERPLAQSEFYRDGLASRIPPAGTVARGWLREDRVLHTGIGPDGKFVSELPAAVPFDKALLARGRQRFDVFCSPCHGRQGNGQGMIVQRGFKQPPSYHIDRLRAQPLGYFFDVMTNGFGQMSSYASQVPAEDRWAIAAYVRTLQFSRNAPLAELTEADRAALDKAAAAPAAAPTPEAHP
ncbi:MAG: cytochrome c [Holophagales bacterium]|nr:cytochrome c [Holophagales bacterium]